MKIQLRNIMFSFVFLFSGASFALQDGTYRCVNGNEPSICPQIIKTIKTGSKLTGLKVYYSGYCNDQGPYFYDCTNGICGDDAIRYTKLRNTSFYWENLPNNFHCSFRK